ncbi:retrovirus-related pol polyprotein from transposon TNT 1-94 [Tanacetum coccineum]
MEIYVELFSSFVSSTPLSTAFFSTSIVHDFQDSPDDEEDTRSSHEYLNDLEEEYQAKDLLAKSKRFFKKVPSYQSPFQSKSLSSSQHKPELRPTKDFEAKYNKVKAKLTLLSLSASDSKASTVKNKGLIAKAYEWLEEEVSSYDNEMVEVKVLMALAEDNDVVSKKGPKVVFGDDFTCTTEGYGSIKCNGIFNEKRGTIFNSNKEVVMIASRVRDVYVFDMTSSAQESCFFAKASENLNWLWHKRLAYLNFKTINKLAKQNLVIGLPSLVYSKDKPCLSCEKGKHHRTIFKTKQISSIKKCLHLLHMDLFGHVTPMSINHEKYTLVIVNEYSRYTWVYFFKKKSQAPETIMSFIKRVENQNDIKVKQLRTDNGSVFSKQYWSEAVATACYTQNRSTIVKRHLKTPYEIFCKRIPNVNFLHVFGCLIYIHDHKDHLEKFNEKADDGYLLGYSLVSKAFRVFNTRRQQTEETYHITFNESPDAIKFSKPLVDNINIAETERYPPDKYFHPYEPSQRYQTNSNDVSLIEPYEYPEPVILETKVSSDQNGQIDQNDHNDQNDQSVQNDAKTLHVFDQGKGYNAMQEELNQFARNKVWTLVPAPYGKTIIGSKWVFKNKKDETGIVIKNKARLVAQGYNQQEGIDYDETFAPICKTQSN